MGILNWITGIFSVPAYDDSHDDLFSNTMSGTDDSFSHDDFAVNPATGLPMTDGIGSVDVAGNPYGMDLSQDDTISSGIDDSFCGGMDDSFSSGNGLDDW